MNGSRVDHDFTTVVALDAAHLDSFAGVLPTWHRHRPELMSRPWLIICDGQGGDARRWRRQLCRLSLPSYELAIWDWPNRDDTEFAGMTQRERMLTSFVRVPPLMVTTPYWLKIDTDVVATERVEPFPDPEWFADMPVAVANPWGYTKPRHWIYNLEEWATTVPGLAECAPLRLPPLEQGGEVLRHKRIASAVCFVDTIWSRLADDLCPGRLPVPSQDTYYYYIAAKRRDLIRRLRFKSHGLVSVSGRRRRQLTIKRAMQDHYK